MGPDPALLAKSALFVKGKISVPFHIKILISRNKSSVEIHGFCRIYFSCRNVNFGQSEVPDV